MNIWTNRTQHDTWVEGRESADRKGQYDAVVPIGGDAITA
jgi:hypothetical protein